MTRLRRLTAALAVAALLLAGCGLPDRTDPKYVGPAVDPKPVQDRAQDPPRPDGASGLLDLVSRYLMTSVAGNVTSSDDPNAITETQTRMKTFMTEQTAAQWRPPPKTSLLVVQAALGKADDTATGKSHITAKVKAIGQLDRDGRLGAAQVDEEQWTEDFEGEEIDGQWRLTKVPAGMLLSVEGFKAWYQPQPIYFWEKDLEPPKLVPDLRYMPRVLPASKRVSEVMQWLTRGPSSWLTEVVVAVSPDIQTKDDPTVGPDKRVTVNLSSKAIGKSPEELRKLSRQIRWSLDGHPPVELSYENSKDTTNASDGYESDNAAVGEIDQERFVVDSNGEVRPVDLPAGGPPELFAKGPLNTAVVSATINRAHTNAALVRRAGNGTTKQLWVSAPGAAADPKYIVVNGIPASAVLSRPAWIDRPAQRFLIADGSRLWAVLPPAKAGDGATAEVVPGVNDVALTNVSAFSVAPDGRRIALIVGNKAMIAALRIENGKLSLGEQRLVANSLGDNQAIGWITETTLAIGGRANLESSSFTAGSYSLVTTSIDGTGEMPLPLLRPTATGSETVTQLSARTNDPTDSLQVLVLFEANQTARVVYGDAVIDIKPNNNGPSPGASGVQQLKLLSPFYAD